MAIELNSLEAAVTHAQLLMGKGRKILGLVGKPGSGKSTLAKLLARLDRRLNEEKRNRHEKHC